MSTGRRRHKRFDVQDPVSGMFHFDAGQSGFEVVNISMSGMCVETRKRLPDFSEEIRLPFKGRQLRLKAIWKIPLSHNPVRYRYGLSRIDEKDDVIDFFVTAGKLDEDEVEAYTTGDKV